MQQLHTTAAAATASELEPLLRAWACSWHAYPDQPTHALYVCTAHRRMPAAARAPAWLLAQCVAGALWGSPSRAWAPRARARTQVGRRRAASAFAVRV